MGCFFGCGSIGLVNLMGSISEKKSDSSSHRLEGQRKMWDLSFSVAAPVYRFIIVDSWCCENVYLPGWWKIYRGPSYYSIVQRFIAWGTSWGGIPNPQAMKNQMTVTRWWFQICFSLFGEDFHVDDHIFQMGWNHQLPVSWFAVE